MRDLSELPVRVYDARLARATLFASLARSAVEISGARQVLWRLFLRDFTAQFRQKILGYAWACLMPLVGMASFVFLNYAGVLRPGELTIPYPVYVYLGTSAWGLMMGAVNAVGGALWIHRDLILRTSVPKLALALSGVAELVYTQLVNLVVFVAILLFFGISPSWGALLFPVMLLPIMLMGVGIGLFLAVPAGIARDVTNMATSLLGLVMFLTPAVYVPAIANRWLQAAVTYNPLTYLVDEPRNMFVRGAISQPLAFAGAVAVALVVLMLGIHAFYLIQDAVTERL